MEGIPRVQGKDRIYMAAGAGIGLDELLELIGKRLFGGYEESEFLIPYEKGQIMSYLMERALVKKVEYEECGIRIVVSCSKEDKARYGEYTVKREGR